MSLKWKKLYASIRKDEKLSQLSNYDFRIWVSLFLSVDSKGRFYRDVRIIKGEAIPLLNFQLGHIEGAIVRLTAAGLFHRYDTGGKAYLLLHDWSNWNPSGNLRYQDSEIPSPPDDICPEGSPDCGPGVSPNSIVKEERKSFTADSHSLSSCSESSSEEEEESEEVEKPPVVLRGESVASRLTSLWNQNRAGFPISIEKGSRIVQAYIDKGTNPREIEKVFSDPSRCKGKKIWEVLEELTPNRKGVSNGQRTAAPIGEYALHDGDIEKMLSERRERESAEAAGGDSSGGV